MRLITKHILLRFNSLLLVLAASFMIGCEKKTTVVIPPRLPKVEIADVPSPASAMIVVEKGSNLQAIANDAYGHRDFSGFVQTFNGISSPERLQAGTTLKTPSLPVAFQEAGLDTSYQSAVNVLCKAWTDLKTFLPAYELARNMSGAQDGQRFSIAPDLSHKLLSCADAIDAAVHDLKSPRAKDHATPRMALNQFAGSSQTLRSLANGHVASLDYETFMMGKGFSLGFTYALIWAKENHQ